MHGNPLMLVQNAEFSYDGQPVVSGLSFVVRRGDYLCVVGENGSGKSTLIRGLLRLKSPSNGKIAFNIAPSEVGYMPQQTAAQKDFPASVFEVVLSGCLPKLGWRPFYSRAYKKRARENLERMGVWELKNRCFRELSGGETQRVLLARALCAGERLLILDEPVAGLDPVATHALFKLVKMLNGEGVTVVMVTHDLSAVADAATVLHLSKKQAFFGSAADYALSDVGRKFGGGDGND